MRKISIKITASSLIILLGALFSHGDEVPQSTPSGSETVYKIDPPETEALLQKKKNLSRWHMGAVLYYEQDGNLVATNWRQASTENSPATLIHDDPTRPFPLNIDTHKFIIDLGEYNLIERFAFRNIGAEGKMQLAYSDVLQSTDSTRWRKASNPINFSGNQTISIHLEPIDTRYILVMLDVIQAGSISSLSVFGEMSAIQARYAAQVDATDQADTEVDAEEESTEFDFATLHSGALISHVGSGSLTETEAMIDEDIETAYEFEAINDEIIVLNLQNQRAVNRISMLYESTPGTLDFYLLDGLPDSFQLKEDVSDDMAMIENNGSQEPLLLATTPQSLGEMLALMMLAQNNKNYQIVEIPSSFFAERSPNFSHVIDKDNFQFNLAFETTESRFMVIRWQSDNEQTTFPTLRVYEINLYGNIPERERLLTRIPLFEFAEDIPGQSAPADAPTTASSIEVIPVDPLLSF